jgi:predicted DNA-binding ribbon-helix-helix protein
MDSGIAKHSIVIAGRRTSVSLEYEFWDDLRQIARGRGETLSQLVSCIDADRQRGRNLSSAIRLFVLGSYRDRETAAVSPPPSSPTMRSNAMPPIAAPVASGNSTPG